ncbi:MAG: putative zinc-binding protein [Armatimonadota bacterium]
MKRAVLSCNGLDKAFGVLAREVALRLSDTQNAEIICPVLLNNSPARYEKALAESSLLIVDGCPTRCATKLANKLGLKMDVKVLVSEQAKNAGLDVSESLRPDPVRMQLVHTIVDGLFAEGEA